MKVLLLVVVSFVATFSFAQENQSKKNESVYKKVFKLLGSRIERLGIGTKISEMKRDGVIERSFVTELNISGALLNSNDHLPPSRSNSARILESRVNGLAFTLNLTSDGRYLLSFSGISIKNALVQKFSLDKKINIFAIDNLDFFIIEIDKSGYSVNGESFKVELIDADFALVDLLAKSKKSYLVVKAGGSAYGWRINSPKGFYDYDTNGVQDENLEQSYLRFSGRYGLSFNSRLKKSWQVRVDAMIRHNSLFAVRGVRIPEEYEDYQPVLEAYSEELGSYEAQKVLYEELNTSGLVITPEVYEEATGITRPVKPTGPNDNNHHYRIRTFFAPSLTISKIVKKGSKERFNIGLKVYGNVKLGDPIYSEDGVEERHLLSLRDDLIGAKLFLRF